jgi:hypothetical protein
MVKKAEQHLLETVCEKIPEPLEKAAAQSLALGLLNRRQALRRPFLAG